MSEVATFFKFSATIPGPGYNAEVKVQGRALLVEEEPGLWLLYGVNPGGMSDEGDTPQNAYINFKTFFKGILEDLAAEAANFEVFSAEVAAFIGQTDKVDLVRWEAARAEARAGRQFGEAFSKMKKVADDPEPQLVSCTKVDLPKIAPKTPAPAPLVATAAPVEMVDEYKLAA